MGMVERVALAIWKARLGTTDGTDIFDKLVARSEWLGCARAALEAMREPTEEMVEAGVTADHGKTLGQRVTNSHRAMIDKAIQESGE